MSAAVAFVPPVVFCLVLAWVRTERACHSEGSPRHTQSTPNA